MFDKRIIATFLIWAAVVIVMDKVLTTSSAAGADATGIAIVSFIAATISMALVWIFGSLHPGTQRRSREDRRDTEKAKRQIMDTSDARIQLLMQLMSDDERNRLKSRLLNEVDHSAEGELSLNDLMGEYPVNHRR